KARTKCPSFFKHGRQPTTEGQNVPQSTAESIAAEHGVTDRTVKRQAGRRRIHSAQSLWKSTRTWREPSCRPPKKLCISSDAKRFGIRFRRRRVAEKVGGIPP